MTKIEKIQDKILEKMQEILSNEQLQKLENVMAIEFHGVEVKEECTDLITSERHWEKILRTFLASKRIENCAEGTLERYNECVTKLVLTLNKRLQDITTNDIRYCHQKYGRLSYWKSEPYYLKKKKFITKGILHGCLLL